MSAFCSNFAAKKALGCGKKAYDIRIYTGLQRQADGGESAL